MAGLNPYNLSLAYTLEQIEEKITFYTEQLDSSTVAEYTKDSSQGSQRVRSADIDKISNILQMWINAKLYKTGQAGTRITSANFGGHL